MSNSCLWKKGQGKTGERTRWLNSPNVYQKVEVLETGTSDPKKITKWVDANNDEWVQDGSPAHSSTPVKIDTLQFVPKNTNPKEFKALQQQIKENRRADKISAGPQSHILEGVTWDEASKLVGEDAANTHTGDHVVLMGAASKGIIQRGYQHNATVYSAPYARNPFDHVTDREIDEYRRVVERKQRGNEYDTDLSESEAISAAQITSPASAPSETEEESRDEHRVLRIETKQAPVRSQPEVVLSDDEFLNAERAHADRTKEVAQPDPNLLPDDEVFLSSGTASPAPVVVVRGPIRAPRDPNLLSDDEVFLDSSVSSAPPPTKEVVVRSQQVAAVQRVVVRGEHTVNGDHSDAHQSTFSHSSKEGSPSKEVSTEDSPKKDKKKKKGLRTPSFLKKKKEKKKDKSSTPQPA
ncbi:protein hu-li tai shao-like [Ostrinia furnacalis]|uniref:protein hu-li tai shao-like n=1 Tax=Ostrinia furnacalis TaxID=93504 RepID=UPI00103F4CB3|nr:protein hu-li tai shao-like [Ostrinia furnacalis]